MSEAFFQVETQGLSPDLSCANGSYDAFDHGSVSADRLADMLDRVLTLPMADLDRRGATEDLCWPNVIVHGPLGMFSFSRCDHAPVYHCEEAGGAVGLAQAMMLVTGRVWPAMDHLDAGVPEIRLPGSVIAVSDAPPAVPLGDPSTEVRLPGTLVGISASPPMGGAARPAFCQFCGMALPAEARFCPGCGQPLKA
jgi:hypothetical protein